MMNSVIAVSEVDAMMARSRALRVSVYVTVVKRGRDAVLKVTHLHVKQDLSAVKETNVWSRVAQKERHAAPTHSRALVKMISSAKTSSV